MAIRNPVEWGANGLSLTASAVRSALGRSGGEASVSSFEVRRIGLSDLEVALRKGWDDFLAYRTDVIFICFIYPLAGLIVARASFDLNRLPLLFPLISGFALIAPCAAAGLYEMSRLRERGQEVSWTDAFAVFRSAAIVPVVKLGLILTGVFLLWLAVAAGLYELTLDPFVPTSIPSLIHEVFTTKAGWALLVLGIGAGSLFALFVLAISAVSFPLLIDRLASVSSAIRTSVRAFTLNKGPMLAWGMIVAFGLVLGAIPALLGLIVVVPVLGHATWHLYRRVVV